MSTGYSFSKNISETDFGAAIDNVTAALKAQGFGVLTTIDVKDTLKKKIDKDVRNYTILGACNPQLAHQAIMAEPEIGILLPCNVVVADRVDGEGLMVSVANPRAMFAMLEGKDGVNELMEEAERRLKTAMENM